MPLRIQGLSFRAFWASRADIQLFGYEKTVVLTIEDDGKGFNVTETNGIGLQQMRIRAESMSAKLEGSSAPGKGVFILLEVQIRYPSDEARIPAVFQEYSRSAILIRYLVKNIHHTLNAMTIL